MSAKHRIQLNDLSDPDRAFVARFAEAWRSRDPQRLVALLHPDVVLVQPLSRPAHGRAQALRMLARFLRLMPEIEIDVHAAATHQELMFLEFTLRGMVGTRPVELRVVDRIQLTEGLISVRSAFFDSLPLISAVARQPWLWPGLARRA